MTKICSKCHWAVLRPHYTLVFWYKCPICAFTTLDKDLLHPDHHESADKYPMTERDESSDIVKTYKYKNIL